MRALTLAEVGAAMGGRISGPITIPTVSAVSTDSRTLVEGSLFFALVGERFDGHDYVGDVLNRGAAAAVVSDPSKVPAKYRDAGRLIVVGDTVEALGRLAAWYRRQSAASVIAVVGSNGKTSTKDMIATVLGSRKRGRGARASYNNAIGVPLTLLAVDPADEFVVVEIGTNHPGEVAALGRIAQPDMSVVTSIDQEHLAFFGDIESVAREEFSLLATMRGRAFAAVSEQAARFAPGELVRDYIAMTYGLGDGADLRATDIAMDHRGQRFKVNGRFEYRLRALGSHNVMNTLAAIAVGMRMRLTHEEMAKALVDVRLPRMRMERSIIGQITLVNDAYNANPGSMRAALAVIDQMQTSGRKVLILGDMLELGDAAVACHQAVGREAGRGTAQVVIAAGTFARTVADGATTVAGTSKRIYAFPTVEMLADKISDLIEPGDLVLLKASRGVRLERLAEPLKRVARSGTGKSVCVPGAAAGR